ncbi:MAG: hypothetical protein QOJ15_4967 [Bradyrhizobium sp.]|nr:hypothetical protein [Bradyrhizobium sp.]
MEIGRTNVAFHTEDPVVELIIVPNLAAAQPANDARIVACASGIADKTNVGLSIGHSEEAADVKAGPIGGGITVPNALTGALVDITAAAIIPGVNW